MFNFMINIIYHIFKILLTFWSISSVFYFNKPYFNILIKKNFIYCIPFIVFLINFLMKKHYPCFYSVLEKTLSMFLLVP